MRRKKRLFVAALVGILLTSSFNQLSAMAKSSKIPTEVTIVNTKNQSISKKTVTVGDRFELDAQVNAGAEDDYLEWKIVSGKRVVEFVVDENYGDEAELKALKAGKAKIQVYVNGKAVKDTITITVKKASSSNGKIRAKGSKIKYEEVYDDFDLEVIKSKASMKEDQLEWSIADKTIVDFAFGRRTGHEVEFYAKKVGTTKIACKYIANGKVKSKITFTVKVVWND